MKHIILIMALLLTLVAPVFADPTPGSPDAELPQIGGPGWMGLPIANTDNLFTPFVNPALMGTFSDDGLGWAHLWDGNKLRDRYWLIANLEGLSYNYEYDKETTGKSVNRHMLALGNELMPAHILPNLYGGTSYGWTNNRFGKGAWRSGFAYRPLNAASLAFTWDNPYQAAPAYRFGAAVRPLALVPGMKGYRLELSADLDYRKNPGDYELLKPTLGLQTQLLDGLNLGGSYNLEDETFRLTFSLSNGKTDLGAVSQMKGKDYYALPYIHLTDKAFRPLLGQQSKNFFNLPLKGSLVSYKAPKYKLGPFSIYDKDVNSINEVIDRVNQAKRDPAVSGITLNNPGFSASFALMQELIAALQDFKASGKTINCYYDNISNGGYIFASAIADNIYLNPLGSVDLRGLSVTSPYFNKLLRTLGVDIINLRSHKYKSAGNMLSEEEMTAAEREVYESMLQSIYGQMTAYIAAGRGDKLKKGVDATIDAGPYYLAQDALNAGLVDELAYEDEVAGKLKDAYGISKKLSTLADYRQYDWAKPKQDLVAVIYASGNIVMGNGTPGQNIAHDTTAKLIRAARKNKDYKGIILRIDSGGGSAQASDIIWHELELAKSENKKPIVVSMAGVAASGGYYIACNADKIVAEPTTLTGSIGVIGLIPNFERMMDKIGVNWSTVKQGENSDFGSVYRAWTEEEKARMTGHIEAIYEDFVGKVDAGRKNLSLDQVHDLAQGRVWTGEQAKQNGLIDELGGLEEAKNQMRELAKLKGQLTLVDATTYRSGLTIEMSGNPLMSIPGLDLVQTFGKDYLKLYDLWKDYQNEPVLILTPISPEAIDF